MTSRPVFEGEGETTNRAERAESRFRHGYLCSQAVLSAFAPDLGMDTDAAFRIAAAFGGGIAGMGETCGAVTGVCMALGLRYARAEPDAGGGESRVDARVKEFVAAFKVRHDSILCRELLGCDLSEPEGGRMAREQNLFATVCPELVRDAAEILEQLLEADPARAD